MSAQLCIAHHPNNVPGALGGLLLCLGHHAALTEALTGPSAADDPTMDAIWGVRTHWGVAGYADRSAALAALGSNRRRYTDDQRLPREQRKWRRPPTLLVHTGSDWIAPKDYRPGALARAWAALEGLTGHRTASAAAVSGTAEPALPINPAVTTLRDLIPGALTSWARVHVEELPAAPPAAGDPATVSAWLARYIDWSAAQSWAGEYLSELAELRSRAQRLVDLPQRTPEPVGPCLERHEGRQCPGTLWAFLREAGNERPSEFRCDTCRATHDSTQWLRVGPRIAAGRRGTAA